MILNRKTLQQCTKIIFLRFCTRFDTSYARVCHSETNGRILVARKSFLPGAKIFSEDALIHIPKSLYMQASKCDDMTAIQDDFVQYYKEYLKQSQHAQNAVTSLYCPANGPKVNEIENIAKHWVVSSNEERKLIVNLATIMSFNSFDYEEGRLLFSLTCTMSHSCQPNCTLSISNKTSTVRAIAPIQEGEELTLSYDPKSVSKPTHERRAYLQRSKEFICNCPRCRALGDDTRQFNCIKKGCTGRHAVCQPSSNSVPYILPCAVCGQKLSPDHEHRLLQDESTFTQRYDAVQQRACDAKPSDIQPTIELLQFPILSRHHSLSYDVAMEKSEYLSGLKMPMEAIIQAKIALNSLQAHMIHPCSKLAHTHYFLGTKYEAVDTVPALRLAVKSHQTAIQMQAILKGRDCRDYKYDSALVRVFNKLTKMQERGEDGEEYPERTLSMTTSTCGFCAVYLSRVDLVDCTVGKSTTRMSFCSEACQQSHAKLK